MRILNLIQCANLGGMEQASLRLMRGLKERGDELRLLSLNPIGDLGPLLVQAGIPHEGLQYLGRGGWRSYGVLREKLQAIKADGMIMTGHHLLAPLALKDFSKGNRILAIHYHHTGVKPAWQWRLIYRIACERFNAITFPCDFIRREAESIYPPVARLAHTIRNPLDIPPLPASDARAQARELLQLESGRPVVGNAGWLIPRKRFDVFLHTAREILNQKPDILFVIAGDGPERERLQKISQDLGIAGSVRWLGWRRDMDVFYNSIDVLLFNSDWDAMGLTPLEAMSHGVPVVCSVANGGLGEILNSERFGFLLSQHDTSALARRVVTLLERPDEAAAIGRAGRTHVQAVCRPEPIVDWHFRTLSGERPAANGVPVERRAVHVPKQAAILFHRVGPYHFARARAAGTVAETALIEIFKSDEVYDWAPVHGADGFQRLTLFEKHPQPARDIQNSVCNALDRVTPTAVAVPGWSDPVAFSALKWCIQHRVPAIMMSESTEWDEQRRFWREWVKYRLVRMCSGGLVGGTPHTDYLVKLGMPRRGIFQGYDAVDNDYFIQLAADARSEGERFRNKYRLPEKYFLASARFVEKKNLFNFIRAYARYRDLAAALTSRSQKVELWNLVLLGDGPLKAGLCSLIDELGLQQYVQLPGFKQYEELPAYYGLARVFVHPSTTEQWGLVVNEAMASGLPVLVSNRCGCAQDLVRDGMNGFTFDPHDVEQMAALLLRMAAMPPVDLAAMGRESRAIVAGWSPERFAQGLAQAVEAAVAVPLPEPAWFDRLLLELLLRK